MRGILIAVLVLGGLFGSPCLCAVGQPATPAQRVLNRAATLLKRDVPEVTSVDGPADFAPFSGIVAATKAQGLACRVLRISATDLSRLRGPLIAWLWTGQYALVDSSDPYRHQQYELPPLAPIITEVQLHHRACPDCGAVVRQISRK